MLVQAVLILTLLQLLVPLSVRTVCLVLTVAGVDVVAGIQQAAQHGANARGAAENDLHRIAQHTQHGHHIAEHLLAACCLLLFLRGVIIVQGTQLAQIILILPVVLRIGVVVCFALLLQLGVVVRELVVVLLLGILFRASDSAYIPPILPDVGDSVELWQLFHVSLPTYFKEIATSLLPIVLMFGVFQLVALKLDRRTLGRISVGLAYTYIGLVLFLTGANVGFMPAGNYLGQVLAGQTFRWLLVPIGMLIGYFIVRAEPAVYVLNKQVEEVTDGAISAGTMGAALSAGVSLSVGLAMVRVLTGISILWFLIPGYAFAIGISFVVPKLYTAIAFDAGGVASGPMTATFLLPLAQGACVAVGGNIVTDAFGVVAMVAMTPLITVQMMGLVAQLRTHKARVAQPAAVLATVFADLPDDAIIEL